MTNEKIDEADCKLRELEKLEKRADAMIEKHREPCWCAEWEGPTVYPVIGHVHATTFTFCPRCGRDLRLQVPMLGAYVEIGRYYWWWDNVNLCWKLAQPHQGESGQLYFCGTDDDGDDLLEEAERATYLGPVTVSPAEVPDGTAD